MTDTSSVPLIDITSLRSGGDASAVARAIDTACRDTGFFCISGHGINPALLDALDASAREFFALPDAVKAEIAMSKGGRAWRGWFPLGGEVTSGVPDRKEGIYFGQELGDDDSRVRAGLALHGPNLFPMQVPALTPLVLGWLDALTELGNIVMSGIALGLGLDSDWFRTNLTTDPTVLFRIFRYPVDGPGDWGVAQHTDYGLLTLLEQDDRGGLEVKTPAGWIAAPPIAGALVCNLGDMLDRLTGGRFRSTPHRVRNRCAHGRYSWPFFLDPAFDALVAPLPTARVRPVDVDAAERWDRASVHTLTGTYGDYLLSKVARVFPQLASDGLGDAR